MSDDFLARVPRRDDVHSYLGIRTVEASPERVVLEMEAGDLVGLLDNRTALAAKVSEAVAVLEEHATRK